MTYGWRLPWPMKDSSREKTSCTGRRGRSDEHTSELQSLRHLVCRLLLEKKKYKDSMDHAKNLGNSRRRCDRNHQHPRLQAFSVEWGSLRLRLTVVAQRRRSEQWCQLYRG